MSASELALNCFILDDSDDCDDPNRIFEVMIESTLSVSALKEAIKKKMDITVPANRLRLWKASCPSSPPLIFKNQLKALTFPDDDCLVPTNRLSASTVFGNLDPAPDLVHVFIKTGSVPG